MKCALVIILTILAMQCSADFVDTLLDAQNAYRTVLNIAPLTWSDDLAQSAQQWADHLAQIGALVHSGSSNGENLAYISGTYTGDTSDTTDNNNANTNTGSAVDNGSNTNPVTDNSSTDNSGADNSNIKDGSSDSSNTDNGNNSSGGFLASKPTTSDQPKTHWSKTKNSHYGVVNTYTGDGGSFDGRTLVGGGRRLSESDAGDSDLVRLVGLWGAEKQYFVYGTFPDVSSTGDWSDVGHYTQLVWANTKQVGCGIANGHGNEYLVCQYYPAGNFDSETVY